MSMDKGFRLPLLESIRQHSLAVQGMGSWQTDPSATSWPSNLRPAINLWTLVVSSSVTWALLKGPTHGVLWELNEII